MADNETKEPPRWLVSMVMAVVAFVGTGLVVVAAAAQSLYAWMRDLVRACRNSQYAPTPSIWGLREIEEGRAVITRV
jgi:hypothetical protein